MRQSCAITAIHVSCLIDFAVGYRDKRLLAKLYQPASCLRRCTDAIFEELIMTLDPLHMLPFRLHTSFEIERMMTMRRYKSMKERKGSPEIAR